MKIEEYLPLLKMRARHAYFKVNPIIPVPLDDCEGEAYVIFCKALQKFDPCRNVKFSTYLFHHLKNLEYQILHTNRMSTSDSFDHTHPSELLDIVPESRSRIRVEELSDDGRKLVTLLLDREIGDDYGQGKGKKLPGTRRIVPYMKNFYGWEYKKTEAVIEEIKDWWRDHGSN